MNNPTLFELKQSGVIMSPTDEIDRLARSGAVFAFGVSGGKDSSIAAIATSEYLDRIGHKGPRCLIHSDLGSVEWKASKIMCERLAERLNIPLITVRRAAGGMMQRWQTRWRNNVQRYVDLSCVKLILPWSTPSMRFCTSELKTSIICRELVKRYRGQTIVNVTGIRREESSGRAKTPITKNNTSLTRKDGTSGIDWHPIAEMTTEAVFLAHGQYEFPLHEAYTTYGSSRVSCSFCIMSKKDDLIAASTCEENAAIYCEMCELEIVSCFSFQSGTWLSDVAPHLLAESAIARLATAKSVMSQRENIESRIPKHLLFTANWPDAIPTYPEAVLLADVRRQVAALQGLQVKHIDPLSLIQLYRDLMEEKERRNI